jgi:hypothetical protein
MNNMANSIYFFKYFFASTSRNWHMCTCMVFFVFVFGVRCLMQVDVGLFFETR